jgi:hypothetical protein
MGEERSTALHDNKGEEVLTCKNGVHLGYPSGPVKSGQSVRHNQIQCPPTGVLYVVLKGIWTAT